MICLITEHVWENYDKECIGPLHIIGNFTANIQPNQTKVSSE